MGIIFPILQVDLSLELWFSAVAMHENHLGEVRTLSGSAPNQPKLGQGEK